MRSYEVYSEGDLFRLFINEVMERLASIAKVDVIIVGAGPAGLSAAISLAEKKLHVVVFERMLGVGGGIRGGGMLLPLVLVEEGYPRQLLEECGVKLKKLGEGLYAADPTESMVKLAAKAIDNGTIIIPGITVEDLITRIDNGKLTVKGVVINWSPIVEAKWHVDPLMVESRAVVDATGHDAGIVRVLAKRYPNLRLNIPGMASMNVWLGEKEVVAKTSKIVEGLYVAGMSVAEVYNTHRMGPILGGMILSGKRVAEQILRDLGVT